MSFYLNRLLKKIEKKGKSTSEMSISFFSCWWFNGLIGVMAFMMPVRLDSDN